jgi:hypothetical protein
VTPHRSSIYDPSGRLQGVAQRLGEKLAGVRPWEALEAPEAGPTFRRELCQMATAGLLLLGLVTLLFFIP